MKIEVGQIQAYPVIYIPEKDIIFCKNTTCKVKVLEYIIYKSPLNREYIEDKNLSVIKDGSSIYFGCLTTTIGNVTEIRNKIKQIKTKTK